jgi:hypothetical protein
MISKLNNSSAKRPSLPNRDHIVVHLLQLLLCGLKGIGWRVELVGLEGFVGKGDREGLVIFLIPNVSAIREILNCTVHIELKIHRSFRAQ